MLGGGATLFALKEIAGVLKAPGWLLILIIVVGLVISIGSRVRETQYAKAQQERELGGLLRSGVPAPQMRDVDVFSEGVTRSSLAESRRASREPGSPPPYIPRTADRAIATALHSDRVVLISGPSKAGKSRTALEIARRLYPDARFLAPSSTKSLPSLLTRDVVQGHAILWLDDLDSFLDAGVLENSGIGMARQSPDRLTIVGTIRTTELVRLRAAAGALGRDARAVLDDAIEIELAFHLDHHELADAESLYPSTDFSTGVGIFTAVAELVDRYTSAGADSVGRALVSAAVDWRRIGVSRGVTRGELEAFVPLYVPGAYVAPQDIEDGLVWANVEVSSAARLLEAEASATPVSWKASDPIIDHDESHRSIPDEAWDIALDRLQGMQAEALFVPARSRGRLDIAERAAEVIRQSQEEPERQWGAFLTGTLRHEAGDYDEAERWYREPSDAGLVPAMNNLGVILLERGDPEGIELLRAAVEPDFEVDKLGPYNLAKSLHEIGKVDEAIPWYRLSADRGHWLAMIALAWLTAEQDPEGAEALLRAAEPLGGVEASVQLGRFLIQRGNEEGEEILRRHALEGNLQACGLLGLSLLRAQRFTEALEFLEPAATEGDEVAMTNLGSALEALGRPGDAAEWHRRAADAGSAHGAARLGELLHREGRDDEALVYLRQASDGGDLRGSFYLGNVLVASGRYQEGARAWEKGADEGDPRCLMNLASLASATGNQAESTRLMRRATETEDADLAGGAHYALGLNAMNSRDTLTARRDLKQSAELGFDLGMLAFGLYRYGEGDLEEARSWISQAADMGAAAAVHILSLLESDELRALRDAAPNDGWAAWALATISYARGEMTTWEYWAPRSVPPMRAEFQDPALQSALWGRTSP